MAHKKHIKKRRRSPIRFLFLLILLIAVLIGIVVFMLHSKLGKVQTKALDQSQLVTVNNDNNMKDYTNYAFIGIDSQTGSMSDRGNRSDSIIVVSINNSTKEVKLLSIYRDTFLSINGKYSKINVAYSWGGPELAISTINRNLDLNIEKYATVNFKILANIVDAVGGIEVNVDKSIIEGDKKENISDNNVGDILTYQVDADIPHYDASTNTQMVKYIITDTLSKGLDFYREGDPENNIDIIVSNFSGESKTLKPGTLETHETTIGEEPYTYYSVTDGDYAVSYDGKTMTLVFDYPDIMAYNNLQLNYQVRINEDAVIGVEGNPNQVDLEYTNNNKTWNTSKPWDKTETYVYGLKINKVDPDGNKLEGAEFQLYAGAPDPDGDYEGRNPLVTYKYENGQLVINSNDGKTAVTDKDGIAYLIGFEAGTYALVETKAPNGYIIPDGQMQLDVVETIGVDEDGKEAVTDVKYTLTTGDEVTELPTEVLGDVEIGDGSVAVTKIVNPKGFNLPRTGGAGTWMFAVGGILIMAGMATAFVKLRKKEN